MLKCLFVSLLLGGLIINGQKLSRNFSSTVEETKRKFDRMIQDKPADLQKTIHLKSQEHRIDPIILEIIVQKESNNGNPRALYRFEPSLYQRLRQTKGYRGLSDGELRMMASSHGPFHILGATGASQCNLHFSELYDVEKSTDCAARIVRRLSDENNGEVRKVFRGYNGSGPMADKYATDAMVTLADLLFNSRAARG